jgi:hypothetical protein
MTNFIIFEDSSKSKFGGGQKVSFELLNIFKRNNFNFSLIDFTKKSNFYSDSKKIVNKTLVLKTLNFNKKSNNNSFTFSNFEIISIIFLFPFNFFRLYVFLLKKSKNSKTVLICTTKKTIIYGILNKLVNPKIILIFHIHNYLNEHLVWSKIMKQIITFTDSNWYVSSTVKLSYGNKANGIIIYNPIELNFNSKLKPVNKIVNIGLVANLLGYKGINYFIKSYDYLPKNINHQIIYNIFGDGPSKHNLMCLSNNNENIIFHGFKPDKEFYNYIDILVCPSIEEEAFSLVIFEATKNSIPVIATNLKVHREFFSNNSLLFINVKSDIEIANSITNILNDEYLGRDLVKNAQNDLLNKFSISFESNILSACKEYFV